MSNVFTRPLMLPAADEDQFATSVFREAGRLKLGRAPYGMTLLVTKHAIESGRHGMISEKWRGEFS